MKINGETHYLWRAVDQESEVLESYVTKIRDKAAALRFMRKALKRHGAPEAITSDGLRSYGAAMKQLGCEQKREIDGRRFVQMAAYLMIAPPRDMPVKVDLTGLISSRGEAEPSTDGTRRSEVGGILDRCGRLRQLRHRLPGWT